jgi:hypothetical protein
MASTDIAFSRALLGEAHTAVKQFAPKTKLRDAWVWHAGRDHWEFHGPNNFYWHGRAGNAYDARFNGWIAWLAQHNSAGASVYASRSGDGWSSRNIGTGEPTPCKEG